MPSAGSKARERIRFLNMTAEIAAPESFRVK